MLLRVRVGYWCEDSSGYIHAMTLFIEYVAACTSDQHTADVQCGQVSNCYYSREHIISPSPMLTNKGDPGLDDFACFACTKFESEMMSEFFLHVCVQVRHSKTSWVKKNVHILHISRAAEQVCAESVLPSLSGRPPGGHWVL